MYRNMRYSGSVNKEATSYRLSPAALALVEKLAKELGISRTAAVELAIRDLAKKRLPAAATGKRGTKEIQ